MTTSAYDLAVNQGFKGTREEWDAILTLAETAQTDDAIKGTGAKVVFQFSSLSRIASDNVNPEHFSESGTFVGVDAVRYGGGTVEVEYRHAVPSDLRDDTVSTEVDFELTQSHQSAQFINLAFDEVSDGSDWDVVEAAFTENGNLVITYRDPKSLHAKLANLIPEAPVVPDDEPGETGLLEDPALKIDLDRLKIEGAFTDLIKNTLNDILFTGKHSLAATADKLKESVAEIISVETYTNEDHTEFKFSVQAQHPELDTPTRLDIIYARVNHDGGEETGSGKDPSGADTGAAQSQPGEEPGDSQAVPGTPSAD